MAVSGGATSAYQCRIVDTMLKTEATTRLRKDCVSPDAAVAALQSGQVVVVAGYDMAELRLLLEAAGVPRRIECIENVQPFSVVRMENGKLGMAPNRANRGMYHVLHCDEWNSATILKAGEQVEVIELAVAVCWNRVVALRKEEDHGS